MSIKLNDIMEAASQALAGTDYARCESLCLDALTRARDAGDWAYYQRIVLPLQEARRLKRQSALDGPIRLGVHERPSDILSLIPEGGNGCMALNACCDAADAQHIIEAAGPCFELLLADNPISAATWTIRSTRNLSLGVHVPAPAAAWRGRWLTGVNGARPGPGHWFMRASEALGDTWLASITAPLGGVERVCELEAAIDAAGDHELLHQALADAARAAHEAGA
ncbi:MAG: hypothetical protein AAGH88_04870 [Planctomycetota bacterium]